MRAIRLAYGDPDLLRTQLRAVWRAGGLAGVEPHVMAPMVATLEDVDLLESLRDEARAAVLAAGQPCAERMVTGIMVEVPAAALLAPELARRVAFFSIGTNDLTQYVMAADRGNAALGRLQDALHPAVLRAVAGVVAGADGAGIPVAVCGELAGDPAGALVLVGLGVDELSADAGSLDEVRAALAACTAVELEALAAVALAAPGAPAVRAAAAEAPRPTDRARGRACPGGLTPPILAAHGAARTRPRRRARHRRLPHRRHPVGRHRRPPFRRPGPTDDRQRTGGANVARAIGPRLALVSGLLDMLKGTVAVLLARALGAGVEVEVLAGLAAIVGHSRSPFLGLSGGRGVAPGFGAGLVLSPFAAAITLAVFVVVLLVWRYSSLASLVGSAAGGLAFAVQIVATGMPPALLGFAIGAPVLVWIFHHDNIGRLLRGDERKLGAKWPRTGAPGRRRPSDGRSPPASSSLSPSSRPSRSRSASRSPAGSSRDPVVGAWPPCGRLRAGRRPAARFEHAVPAPARAPWRIPPR